MRMPKSKPTAVHVHRIEFNNKEREMLETYMAAQTVKSLVIPAAAGAGVYVAYKAARAAYGWTEDIVDKVKENRPAVEAGVNAGVSASAAGPIVDFLRFMF